MRSLQESKTKTGFAEDVYEAGAIDGATGWNKFKNLTFPLILPFFTINMVLCVKKLSDGL